MKSFLRLDAHTIPNGTRSTILQNAKCLTALEHNLHLFEYSVSDFIHAQALFTQHPETYGNDLSIYLPTVINHLKRNGDGLELSLSMGSSDFKRKLSEDFGVALAALFMHRSFGVDWNTIAQIPANKRLQFKRPDFQGFGAGDECYYFEAKGTTGAATLERQIAKGLEQIKRYPKPAKEKLLIASYISGDATHFPTTTFVIDPPFDGQGVETRSQAIWLHQLHILNFIGLHEQAALYGLMLGEAWKIDEAPLPGYRLSTETTFGRTRDSYRTSWDNFNLRTQQIGENTYYVVDSSQETPEGVISIKRGVIRDRLDQIKQFKPIEIPASFTNTETDELKSFFDDGTFLAIEIKSQ